MILTYHDVSNPGTAAYHKAYSTPQEQFKKQIEFLLDSFELVSLDKICRPDTKSSSSKPLLSLTFDDGFYSVKEFVFPYLMQKHIPFTVFFNQQAITDNSLDYGSEYGSSKTQSNTRIYCNASDVLEMSRRGVTIGNHSKSHANLSTCDTVKLHEEIVGCKNFIEKIINNPIRHFSIPFGKKHHFTADVLDICFKSGHEFVFSSNPTLISENSQTINHLLPRISVLNETKSDLLFLLNRPLFKKIDL